MNLINTVKYSMLFCVIVLLLPMCKNDIEFVKVIDEYHSTWYDMVLVKNMPKDYTEQSKIMIAYFDSAGPSSINDIPTIERTDYTIFFYRSTHATRKIFIEMRHIPYNDRRISFNRFNRKKTILEL